MQIALLMGYCAAELIASVEAHVLAYVVVDVADNVELRRIQDTVMALVGRPDIVEADRTDDQRASDSSVAVMMMLGQHVDIQAYGLQQQIAKPALVWTST